jgi:hypothetical protein
MHSQNASRKIMKDGERVARPQIRRVPGHRSRVHSVSLDLLAISLLLIGLKIQAQDSSKEDDRIAKQQSTF